MNLERALRRSFVAVPLALVALVAFFAARTVSQVVGGAMAADEKQLAAPPLQVPAAKVVTGVRGNGQAILDRNPFDHVTGALKEQPKVEVAPTVVEEPTNVDHRNDPPCEGVKVLAIVESPRSENSFAAFSVSGEAKTQIRRQNQEIGSKTVEYIGWDRVWLKSGRTYCQAEIFKGVEVAKPAAAAPEPAKAAAPSSGGGAPGVDPAIAKGIQKVGPREYNIDRATVDKILENQAELMKTARIVPEKEGDKTVGIKLFGVRPDTLLGVIGMENGDRLQTINGFDIANPEKALEAYARLRTADKLVLQVNRRGENMNLDYNIK
jgi:general secretion pathway protein C